MLTELVGKGYRVLASWYVSCKHKRGRYKHNAVTDSTVYSLDHLIGLVTLEYDAQHDEYVANRRRPTRLRRRRRMEMGRRKRRSGWREASTLGWHSRERVLRRSTSAGLAVWRSSLGRQASRVRGCHHLHFDGRRR